LNLPVPVKLMKIKHRKTLHPQKSNLYLCKLSPSKQLFISNLQSCNDLTGLPSGRPGDRGKAIGSSQPEQSGSRGVRQTHENGAMLPEHLPFLRTAGVSIGFTA